MSTCQARHRTAVVGLAIVLAGMTLPVSLFSHGAKPQSLSAFVTPDDI